MPVVTRPFWSRLSWSQLTSAVVFSPSPTCQAARVAHTFSPPRSLPVAPSWNQPSLWLNSALKRRAELSPVGRFHIASAYCLP